MKPKMFCYSRCGTCKKAKKWLTDNQIEITELAIDKNPPSADELTVWIDKSNLPLKRFFNTSGKIYRELNLKDTFDERSREELIQLLSENGMLIKRPLLVTNQAILVGFKEDEWTEKLK